VEARDEPGADWEGDLIIGSKHKQAIVTLVDRSTRYTFMEKVPFKTAQAVQEVICRCLTSVKALFKSCTFDNGKEFAHHEKMSEELEGKIYFAHPYSSWERGTNENTNGLIRQYFPKDRDFTTITDEELQLVQDKLNNRPRKVLNSKTPNELLFGISPSVALGY
jgi:IS30 family transposase